jgi:hypothetical protein
MARSVFIKIDVVGPSEFLVHKFQTRLEHEESDLVASHHPAGSSNRA